MYYNIRWNIVNIATKLCLFYYDIVPELKVFILLPTKTTKPSDFICTFEKKQEV